MSGEQAHLDRDHRARVKYFSHTVVMVLKNTATGNFWVDTMGSGGVFLLGGRFWTPDFDNDIS